MKNKLLPDRSSKVVLVVVLAFILIGLYFIALTDDPGTGWGILITGVVMMLVLFIKNATARPGQ